MPEIKLNCATSKKRHEDPTHEIREIDIDFMSGYIRIKVMIMGEFKYKMYRSSIQDFIDMGFLNIEALEANLNK